MRTVETSPISAAELSSLFHDLECTAALVLAVSGGPDSTALMVLAARWCELVEAPPKLIAVTIDHGLRKEAKREATAVAKLARKLKISHRTLRWAGKKPKTGVQQAAREARYRLLAQAAREAGATFILTAHTHDDQAETVLIRLCRGSGMTGLGAMGRISALPTAPKANLQLVRPFLKVPKSRLIATLRAAKIPFVNDPSNRDPRFTRARLRLLMSLLEKEGLTAEKLTILARRIKRANVVLEAAVDRAATELVVQPAKAGAIVFNTTNFMQLPEEIALQLLDRAIAQTGDEGPVELAKLETLTEDLLKAHKAGTEGFRRTLAGACVTLRPAFILVERAPPRRRKGRRGERNP